MSYENKGSMATTVLVTREPDRSGNHVCDGAADDVQIQAAIDEVGRHGGGLVVLDGGSNGFTTSNTININKHGIEVWQLGDGPIDFDGAGPAIETNADVGNYIRKVRLYNIYINAVDNGNCTYGVFLEDVQDCAVYNLRVIDISDGIGLGIAENASSEVCHIDIYHTFMHDVKHGIEVGEGVCQVTVTGGQINGTNAAEASGTYGVFQHATGSYDLTCVGLTTNTYEHGYLLEGDKWVLVNPQIENCRRGVRAPNTPTRGCIINPKQTNVTLTQFDFPAAGRVDMLYPEVPKTKISIPEKAGAPAGGDFDWLRQMGFVYDTVNNRLYFIDSGGNLRWMAVT